MGSLIREGLFVNFFRLEEVLVGLFVWEGLLMGFFGLVGLLASSVCI